MKKLTSTLILALLAANALALGGCEFGKCLSCTGTGDASTCAVCVGGSPKATTANPAVFDCSGTPIEGCLVNLTEGKCKVCERTRVLSLDKKTCPTATSVSVTIPADPLCLAVFVAQNTNGTDYNICTCKGKSIKTPVGYTPTTPLCTSIDPIIPNCEA